MCWCLAITKTNLTDGCTFLVSAKDAKHSTENKKSLVSAKRVNRSTENKKSLVSQLKMLSVQLKIKGEIEVTGHQPSKEIPPLLFVPSLYKVTVIKTAEESSYCSQVINSAEGSSYCSQLPAGSGLFFTVSRQQPKGIDIVSRSGGLEIDTFQLWFKQNVFIHRSHKFNK